MRAIAWNAHLSFVITGSPRERFGEGLGCVDVAGVTLSSSVSLRTEIHEPAWDSIPCKEQKELRHLTVQQHGVVPPQMPDTASCYVFSVHALKLVRNPLIGQTDVSALWEWRDFCAPKSHDCPCLWCVSATLSLFYTCILSGVTTGV